MISVEIPFSNDRVFDLARINRVWMLRDDVRNWLRDHVTGGYGTDHVHGDCVEQIVGVRFSFLHESQALLFKLTWA